MKASLPILVILYSLLGAGCSTYPQVKAPCSENASGKIKINQW